jgi:hypothetical protein
MKSVSPVKILNNIFVYRRLQRTDDRD